MIKQKQFLFRIVAFAVTVAALVFVLSTRTPDELGPGGIAFFFLLSYLLLMQLIAATYFVFSALKTGKASINKAYTIGSGVALPVVLLLALNTIRPLTLADYGFGLVFGIILTFYLLQKR